MRQAERPRADGPGAEGRRSRPWLLPLLAALIVIPYPYFPALRSPNEGSRLYQARAIVDDGTFALDGEIRRYGQMGDLSHSERGYFPNKAPGISFLGAGVYWVARLFEGGEGSRLSNEMLQYLLRLFCCEIPTLVLLFFLRRELWRWSDGARDGLWADIALAAYALGSLAYTYSLLYFGHQLTAVCLMGSFLAIEASRRQARESQRLGLLALAGLLAGTAVFVEYPGALAALPLGLYVLWVAARRWRSVLVFGLASLPPQLVLLWYHKVCFGSPFSIGYRNNVNAQFNQWTARGFVGVSLPTWEGFWGSLFSPARGLFIFSPFLLLAFYGLAQARKRRELERPAILMGILTVLYLLFAASFVYEGWGWTVGPRHITPLAAFLLPPVALALAELGRRSAVAGGVGVGLCVLSVVITSLATVTYPHFPEVFTNGFFEVTVPLLAGGYLPRNLLGLLAHAQAFGWVAFFGGWLFLLGWMVARGGRTALGRVAILGTVASGLLLLSVLGRGDSVEKQQMLEFIRRTYRSG